MANNPPPPPPPPPPPLTTSDRPGDSDIYAFVVGINEYKENQLTALRGCDNDVERIVNYLKWRYLSPDPLEEDTPGENAGDEENPTPEEEDFNLKKKEAHYPMVHPGYGLLKILWLRDEEATRQDIIDGFEVFLAPAKSGDMVWFHFSGHGTEVPTTAQFEDLENGMDQCLICHDNLDDGTHTGLLADKEIAQLLKTVAEGEDGMPQILVTLDSCYSGTGTRGEQEIEDEPGILARGIEIDLNLDPRALSTYYGYENEQDYELPPSHVVLTACTSDQLAGDRPIGGVFTNALIDALEESNGDINYSDLNIHTRVLVKNERGENQTPQFDVIGNAKAYGLFLNGTFNGFPDRYEIDYEAGSWIVKAGAIHHLPLESSDPILLDIYASNFTDQRDPIAMGMVAEVGPQFSTLVLNTTLDSDDKPFFGKFRRLPVPPVRVLLNVGSEAESIKSAWPDKANSLNIVPLVPGIDENISPYDLELRVSEEDENQYKLKDIQLNKDVDWAYEKDELIDVHQDLNTISNWKRILSLQNDDSELTDKIELKLTIEGRDNEGNENDLVIDSTDGEILIEATANNDLWTKRDDPLDRKYRLKPKITIEGVDQDLYFYLFWLYEDYEIKMYSAEKTFPGLFGSGDVDYISRLVSVNKGEDEFNYNLKLFVTTSQLAYYRLIQTGIPGERGKDEDDLEVEDGFHKWHVIDRKIKVIRKEEEIQTTAPTTVIMPDPTNRTANMGFTQSHAFVIGINEYPNLNANLRNAVQDAQDIAMRLRAIQGFDNVALLTDVNYAQLSALLNWLKAAPRPQTIDFPLIEGSSSNISWLELELPPESPEDTPVLELILTGEEEEEGEEVINLYQVPEKLISIEKETDSIVFYFAGHGFQGGFDDSPTGFIAPSDARNRFLDNNAQISMDEVYQALVEVGCHHTLLILDCCFAGQFRFASTTRGKATPNLFPMYRKRFERYKARPAWQVLVSSGPDQLAADSASLAGIRDNSPFANTLKKALEGVANVEVPSQFNRGKILGDGVITASELYLYVWDNVEKMTADQGRPQHPSLIRMENDDGGEFIFFNPKFSFDQLPSNPDRNPYKGLLSYEPEDSPWFFGRDEDTKNLVAKVTDTPVVVVTAPSAYGKSSIVKAGLFPHLRDQHQFELLVLRPGALPWSGDPVVDNDDNTIVLYYTGLEKLKTALDPNKKQLVLVDQYEEVFTESENAVDLHTFETELELLKDQAAATAIDGEDGALRIVIALRSDFEWQLESSTFGQSIWNEGLINQPFLYRLGAMGLNELRDALTDPAYVQAYEFEDQLEERILEDVANAPGALPLLSFTMQEFHNISNEEVRRFTIEEYTDKLKGVIGALRNRADYIYNEEDLPINEEHQLRLNETERNILPHILLRMVQLNEGQFTSRRIMLGSNESPDSLNELDFPNNEDDSLVEGVLDKMEEAHLFVRGQDENGLVYVELAHDALITHWPRYQQWIKDFGKEQLVLQRRLWQAVTDWKKASN